MSADSPDLSPFGELPDVVVSRSPDGRTHGIVSAQEKEVAVESGRKVGVVEVRLRINQRFLPVMSAYEPCEGSHAVLHLFACPSSYPFAFYIDHRYQILPVFPDYFPEVPELCPDRGGGGEEVIGTAAQSLPARPLDVPVVMFVLDGRPLCRLDVHESDALVSRHLFPVDLSLMMRYVYAVVGVPGTVGPGSGCCCTDGERKNDADDEREDS